ncbi:MAG: hypothetical protein V4857_17025 [Pseudomonadota bacterium]
MKSATSNAIFAATLLCAGGASAQDAAFCKVLAKVMPLAAQGLSALKEEKLSGKSWAARITMPKAKACEILVGEDDEDMHQPSYSCTYAVAGTKNEPVMAEQLVSSVKACRPDMKRWMTSNRYYFKAPEGVIQISISSALVAFEIYRSK